MRLKKMAKCKATNVTLIRNELSNFDNDYIDQAIKHQRIASFTWIKPIFRVSVNLSH